MSRETLVKGGEFPRGPHYYPLTRVRRRFRVLIKMRVRERGNFGWGSWSLRGGGRETRQGGREGVLQATPVARRVSKGGKEY